MKGHHRLLLALEELWVFAFGWIPTPLGRLVRLAMWRWMFARCGSVRFNTGIGMVGCHNMRLGNQVRVGRNCILTAGNGKLELADQVSLSPGVHLCADGGSIFIGVKTAIGPGTVIRSANHCFTRQDVPIMEQGHEPGVVVIEDDVWIAANCTVTPNVRIGRGAVVGAGAVVTRDVQPYDIVAGVPARPIGKRGKDMCLNQVGEMDDDMY